MKAAGYVRVSTDKSANEGQSLQTQKEQIAGYCQAKKWNLIIPFYEEQGGVSGATMDRPQLRKLLLDAAQKKFSVVVVADVSRFGRNTLDLLKNTELLHSHNIKFASIRENIDDSTPNGKFNLQILSSISELERETIKIRTSENRNARRKNQDIFLGWAPYGYRWNKQEKKVETVKAEAASYQKIVWYYLKKHFSFVRIAHELQLQHVPTRTGKRWQPVVVGDILKRPVYWSGQVNSNGDGKSYPCEALIKKSTWDEIQDRIKDRKIRSGRPSPMSDNFLLYGALRCGHCGAKLQGVYGSKPRQDGTFLRSYVCGWARASERQLAVKGREKCPQGWIDADEIERISWDSLVKRLVALEGETVEAVSNAKQLEIKEQELSQKMENLQKEIEGVNRALERLDLSLRKVVFNEAEYKSRRETWNIELRQYEVELGEAQEELDELRRRREGDAEFEKFARDNQTIIWDIQAILKSLPFAEKQKLLLGMLYTPCLIKAVPAGTKYPENDDGDDDENYVPPPPPGSYFSLNWRVDWGGSYGQQYFTFKFNETIFQEVLVSSLPGGDENTKSTLDQAVQQLGLSARAYHRILKVARTIADLEAEENIRSVHLLEAIQYRSLDRRLF